MGDPGSKLSLFVPLARRTSVFFSASALRFRTTHRMMCHAGRARAATIAELQLRYDTCLQ